MSSNKDLKKYKPRKLKRFVSYISNNIEYSIKFKTGKKTYLLTKTLQNGEKKNENETK